jgi:hypothetical protein
MVADFPRDIAEVSGEFLSSVLGVPVEVLGVSMLEGGVLSDAYRVGVRCSDLTASSPSSVVVKLPSSVKERRDFAVSVDAYTKELNFYRYLADEVPIRSPRIYGCRTEGAEEDGDFVIVMEDLTVHSKVFDQVEDPPDEAFARKLAMEAAKLHAAYWESPVTRMPWVGRSDGRYVFSLDALCRLAPSSLAPFAELWRTMYGTELFSGAPDIEELTVFLCGPRCNGILARIYDKFSSRPHTLLHGDMRADNVFRTVSPEGGSIIAESELTFVDWQVIHAGPPGPEFTQAWMHSLEPEVRRKDREILQQYHDRLVSLNASAASYTYAMLVEDYTLAFCFWWTALISLGVGTLPNFDRPEGSRMKQLWGKGAARAFVAMRDLDCLSLITDLATGLSPDLEPAVPISDTPV